ncbi:MAG: CrcB family protein [Candidatus Obscuribacterales bacterium]|nr:CrcB family protein [Steroidobacteraceae bacterium]
MTYLYVAFGSALGGVARYGCTLWISSWTNTAMLPWATIIVNVTGSLLIGVVLGATEPGSRFDLSASLRDFLMIGVLGGYTTFSAFSLQTFELLRAHHWLQAGANVVLSVLICVLAVALGYWLMTAMHPTRTDY